jgi:predicted O-linked N-acetylglucosamine transferase (SPINDLY family)
MDAEQKAFAAALKHYQLGRPDEATRRCSEILERRPDHADALNLLAVVAARSGDLKRAQTILEGLCRRPPDNSKHLQLYGYVLRRLGRLGEALAALDRALAVDANDVSALNERALTLMGLRRLPDAVATLRRAIAIKPDVAVLHNNLGTALRRLDQRVEALAAFTKATKLDPNYAEARANRATILYHQGSIRDALAEYEAALRREPDFPEAITNYLFCLNVDPTATNERLSAAYRRWGKLIYRRIRPVERHANRPDPDRPLNVGLVSADFRRHPVAFNTGAGLAALDREAFRLFFYSNRPALKEDEWSERLKSTAHVWRRVDALSDRDLAQTIIADEIDLLLDLSGYADGHRLGCFAWHPAPVQAEWLHPHTTGLPAIEYALWDPVLLPPGFEKWHTEKIIRLPDVRFCYAPPPYASEPAPPPVLQRGRITFGSFNKVAKLNDAVVDLWARLLDRVPGSRLLLNWKTLTEAQECERLRRLFAARGVAGDRLTLTAGTPTHAGVLGDYADIDIALDPFPFSGGTTTLEALWMAVPVVTLPKDTPISRQALGLITPLGRLEWAARDAEDYLRIAADLAAEPERLAHVRAGQRRRMAASPICDAARFAGHLQAALRGMWREWCARRHAG